MNCVNGWHYLGTCRRNLLQTLFDARLKSASDDITTTRLLQCVLVKNFHTTTRWGLHKLCQLKSRGIIQLSGKDSPGFLQGLVTNNVLLLAEKSPSVQYCMMLNVQGRVLYDLFVYNITKAEADPGTFLVDVDASSVDDLVKIFRKYKLRKKVDISNANDIYKVWTEFDMDEGTASKGSALTSANTFRFHDPRVPLFANRLITDQDSSDSNTAETDYRKHRYQWGIPEGVEDLPLGKCLPLESNLDYMNGVNFQKGCYVGQELTARTFHTGVIRKRLVPYVLNSSGTIKSDTTITTQGKGKNAGKLRSSDGEHGLCLLRLEHAADNLEVLSTEGLAVSLKVHIPKWWPST